LLVYYGFPGATMDTYEADGLLIRVGVVRHRDRDGLRIVALEVHPDHRPAYVGIKDDDGERLIAMTAAAPHCHVSWWAEEEGLFISLRHPVTVIAGRPKEPPVIEVAYP
jgi:hypothetical protein